MAEKEGFGNQGVNAVEPAFSKCPPDIYIKLFKSRLNFDYKKNSHPGGWKFLYGGEGGI